MRTCEHGVSERTKEARNTCVKRMKEFDVQIAADEKAVIACKEQMQKFDRETKVFDNILEKEEKERVSILEQLKDDVANTQLMASLTKCSEEVSRMHKERTKRKMEADQQAIASDTAVERAAMARTDRQKELSALADLFEQALIADEQVDDDDDDDEQCDQSDSLKSKLLALEPPSSLIDTATPPPSEMARPCYDCFVNLRKTCKCADRHMNKKVAHMLVSNDIPDSFLVRMFEQKTLAKLRHIRSEEQRADCCDICRIFKVDTPRKHLKFFDCTPLAAARLLNYHYSLFSDAQSAEADMDVESSEEEKQPYNKELYELIEKKLASMEKSIDAQREANERCIDRMDALYEEIQNSKRPRSDNVTPISKMRRIVTNDAAAANVSSCTDQ